MGDTREITIESLKNKLLSVLRIDDFWKQFMEVVGDELAIQRENLSKKKYLFDIDVQLENGLIDIAEMFGYTPNLIVDNSLSLVRKEAESVPYRIRNKTTYDGYYVNFKQIHEIGEIYNFYWSGKKLIKAVVYASIIEYLNNANLTEPFTHVIADKNFSTISYMNPVFLDNGYNLDGKQGQVLWHLDSDTYIIPTKHLGIEYYVTQMLDEEYLITSKYFRYMEEGVAYTRRVPIVPHVGVQLIAPMIQNTGFDYLNENLDYTVPALQLKCGTVFQFNKNFVAFDLFKLDDNKTLDETIPWKLDNNAIPVETITAKDFKYISCGNGTLSLPSNKNINLFDYANMLLFYTFGDNDNSVVVNDYSARQTNASITGDTKKISGIIGRTVNFNGETYVRSDSTVTIVQNVFTLGFWFNANHKDSYGDTEVQYLVDFDFLKVWYVYSEEKLYYIFGTQNGSMDALHDTVYQILFEVDNPNQVLNIYLNTNLEQTLDISGEGISGNYYVTIGADSNSEHLFNGLIDSFWIMSKLFSAKEKEYIFDNKVGIIVQLANKMAVYEIDTDHETYENNSWMLIQSYCSANDIKEEFGFFVDNTKDVYTGKINFVPVLANYFDFVYIDNDNNKVTIYADKDGNFYNKELNSFISGQVNYETGEFTIYKKTEKYKTQQVIGSTTRVRQLIIQRTDTSTEEISYFELLNDALSALDPNKLVDLTDAVEEKHVLKLPLTGDVRYEYVYDNGSQDEIGNPIYYIDFYCTEVYHNYYYDDVTHEIVEIDSTVDVDNPAEINIYYENALVTTPLINLSANLEPDVKPYTLGLRYTIGGIHFSAQDNGEGLVTGNHFYGQIDYATGLLVGSFSEGYYPDDDVLAFYTYYYSLNMKNGSAVYFNYKVRNSLDITEIGLENENHELLAYMTCAPIQFNSINNHVSVLFAIRKN